MTDKDQKLIEKAKKLSAVDWEYAYELAEQAETETAREFIRYIASLLFHRDEERAGLL